MALRVVVTGATGFIGRRLQAALRARGDTVAAFTRDPIRGRALLGEDVPCIAWEPTDPRGPWEQEIAQADAIVHLAGEPVMTQRWNDRVKARIRDSRVEGTRHIVDAVLRSATKPRVLVCASGMDYYGDRGDALLDESAPAGKGFLPEVCLAWEAEAQRIADRGVREVRLRTSTVLGERGGALEAMERPFRFFVGGPIGGGAQWISWIHLDDMVRVILACIDDERLRGPVNVATPNPVRMKEFSKELGRALHRPSWAPVPAFALRAAIGPAADVVLASKRLVPRALEAVGFVWEHPLLADALRAATRDV